MATTTMQSKAVKQLKELLQEKQDPFILDLYPVERGYLTNSFNSRKSPRRSVSCSKLFRDVCSRLRIRCSNHFSGNAVVTENKETDNQEKAAELDRFSSASSSSTVSKSCTGSDAEDTSASQQNDRFFFKENTFQPFMLCNPIQKEAVTDRKLRWQCIEQSRQLSPVSILDEAASHRDESKDFGVTKETNPSKGSCILLPTKVTENSILAASLWKVLIPSANEKKPNLPGVSESQKLAPSNDVSSQYLKSKTVLQQTRQLLLDCVREMVDNQERKKQQQLKRAYLASEELGKHIIREKIKCWGKHSGEDSDLAELLESDLLDSVQEWSGFKSQRRKIGFEIGDAIFEDVRTEIVMDVVNFLSPINGC